MVRLWSGSGTGGKCPGEGKCPTFAASCVVVRAAADHRDRPDWTSCD